MKKQFSQFLALLLSLTVLLGAMPVRSLAADDPSPAVYPVHWNAGDGQVTPALWSGDSGKEGGVIEGQTFGKYRYNPNSTYFSSRDLPVPTHDTLVFSGWYTDPDQGTQVTADTPVTPPETGEFQLFAHWAEGRTVTLDPGEGYLKQTEYRVALGQAFGTACKSLPQPTRNYYSFQGWYAGEEKLGLDTVISEDVTYTARWTPWTYTVDFEANGGTGTMASQTLTYGLDQTLAPCTFTRPGYSLTGWGSSRYDREPIAQDQGSYSPYLSYDNQRFTLYAMWEETRWNLTFQVTPQDARITVTDLNGQTAEPADGVYRLLAGPYSYTVSAYGYEPVSGSGVLEEDTQITADLVRLPDYRVRFQVTLPEEIPEAQICVFYGEESIRPEADGSFRLIPGEYTYEITAPGCTKVTGSFSVADQDLTVSAELALRTAWDGETRTEPHILTAEEAVDALAGMEGWYQITCGDEMAWFANKASLGTAVNGVMTRDVDLGGCAWTPICRDYSTAFSGTFDGLGHSVLGLSCTGKSHNFTGLFGNVSGTVRNLTVWGSVDVTATNAGGIVGKLTGTLENCTSQVSVTNREMTGYTGGLVGSFGKGTIRSCVNRGSVTGCQYLGGVAGFAAGESTITDCYNLGTLTGAEKLEYYDDWSYEWVSLTGYMGGILGRSNGYAKLTVENCYNAGAFAMTDAYENLDSIAGELGSKSTAVNCCYLDAVPSSAGTAMTAEELTQAAGQLGSGYKFNDGCGGGFPLLTREAGKAHTPVTDEALAPDCTHEGLTEGSHCSVCGQILVPQETVPALGHSWGEWETVLEPTCREAGMQARTCALCGETETEEIPAFPCASDIYTDLPVNAWYHDDVEYMIHHGHMVGVSDTSFDPEGTVTRAQAVTILFRISGEAAPESGDSFQDVPEDSWFAEAVRWARAKGIVIGVTDHTFAPDREISREELVCLLYRWAEAEPTDEDLTARFPDADALSPWAVDAMNWAVAQGIIRGDQVSPQLCLLNPAAFCTRAQAARIFAMYLR